MKLNVAYIVQDDEFWMPISLMSVLNTADRIIIIDGGSKDKTLEKIDIFNDDRITIYHIPYRKGDKRANGKQRNEYLKILKKECMGEWCLVLDADEVVCDDFYKIKEYLKEMEKVDVQVGNVHMEHFIKDFAHVDATIEKHYVPRRFFKITENIKYPEVEHPVLSNIAGNECLLDSITIFHYGYTKGMNTILKKYENNVNNSNMHTKEFLLKWKIGHLLGEYPVKKFEGQHPRIVREVFGL